MQVAYPCKSTVGKPGYSLFYRERSHRAEAALWERGHPQKLGILVLCVSFVGALSFLASFEPLALPIKCRRPLRPAGARDPPALHPMSQGERRRSRAGEEPPGSPGTGVEATGAARASEPVTSAEGTPRPRSDHRTARTWCASAQGRREPALFGRTYETGYTVTVWLQKNPYKSCV